MPGTPTTHHMFYPSAGGAGATDLDGDYLRMSYRTPLAPAAVIRPMADDDRSSPAAKVPGQLVTLAGCL